MNIPYYPTYSTDEKTTIHRAVWAVEAALRFLPPEPRGKVIAQVIFLFNMQKDKYVTHVISGARPGSSDPASSDKST